MLNNNVSLSRRPRLFELSNAPVLWNGDVYMTDALRESGKLLKYSISRDTWNDYILPCDAEMHYWSCDYVITMYGSRLLLIACNRDSLQVVNTSVFSFKVWVFDAATSTFEPSPDITPPLDITLPSDTMPRLSIAAASGEKCLIISGKLILRNAQCFVHITFDGATWVMRDGPWLNGESSHQLLFHNHSIFLIETCAFTITLIYETSLQSLIDNDPDPWQLLKSTMPSDSRLYLTSNFITLDTHFSLVSYSHEELKIWHYFVNSECWQEAGYAKAPSLRERHSHLKVVRLPDESLMTICYGNDQFETMVYKLKPKCELYNSNNNYYVLSFIIETLPQSLVCVTIEKEGPPWIVCPFPSFACKV